MYVILNISLKFGEQIHLKIKMSKTISLCCLDTTLYFIAFVDGKKKQVLIMVIFKILRITIRRISR